MRGPYIIYYMPRCLVKYPTNLYEISPVEEKSLNNRGIRTPSDNDVPCI